MAPEIMPADPRLRRITMISVSILIAAGFALMYYVLPRYLEHLRLLARHDPLLLNLEYRRAFLVMFSIIGILAASIGVHLLRIGRAVVKHECFPPPQVKVILDTKIVRGVRARRFGVSMSVVAVLFMSIGIGGSVLMYFKTTEMLAASIAAPALLR